MDASVLQHPAPVHPAGELVGIPKESIKRAFLNNLLYVQGKFPALATMHDYYMALAHTVRDHMLEHWISTAETYTRLGSRTVAYFSAEFLLGPHLGNNLVNLGIYDEVRLALRELGLSFEELLGQEPEPGLGNGGLGRLAACFLDSLATLEIPAIGYGIRYEFGIFAQDIIDGQQVELTDKWLRYGNPWELARPEWGVEVKLGGHTYSFTDEKGRNRIQWEPSLTVVGTPYDTPILGYRNHTANTLRLWQAEAPESFDLSTCTRRWCQRTSPRSSTPTTSRSRARSFACSSSTSSSPAPCRTCCASCACRRSLWSDSTRNLRFSSTTPTPPWPSPSSCVYWWTRTAWHGRPPGTSPGVGHRA